MIHTEEFILNLSSSEYTSLTTQRRFDDSVTEHRSIVENICSGNWKEADRVNKIHLALAREEIIQHFESKKAVEEEQENE